MKAHRAADLALKAKTKGQDDGEQRNGSEDPRSIDLWSEIVWRMHISRRKGRNAKPRKTIPCICDILTEYRYSPVTPPVFLTRFICHNLSHWNSARLHLLYKKGIQASPAKLGAAMVEKDCYTTGTSEARSSHSRRDGAPR